MPQLDHDLPNDLVPLNRAWTLLPLQPNGKGPHLSTWHRWERAGCRGVRLSLVRIGGRTFVSKTALASFLRAINSPSSSPTSAPSSPAAPLLAARDERVADQLDAIGI